MRRLAFEDGAISVEFGSDLDHAGQRSLRLPNKVWRSCFCPRGYHGVLGLAPGEGDQLVVVHYQLLQCGAVPERLRERLQLVVVEERSFQGGKLKNESR